MGVYNLIQIGSRIRDLRQQKGLTQKYMAEQLKIHKGTYSNYENNHREPSEETLQSISALLGVTLEELLGVDKTNNGNKWISNISASYSEWMEHFDCKRTQLENHNKNLIIEFKRENHTKWSETEFILIDLIYAAYEKISSDPDNPLTLTHDDVEKIKETVLSAVELELYKIKSSENVKSVNRG